MATNVISSAKARLYNEETMAYKSQDDILHLLGHYGRYVITPGYSR